MATQDPKATVAPEAIHVEAATTVSGPAATTISVEVDTERLDDAVKGDGTAERAFAMVPRTRAGKAEWTEEELHSGGTHVNAGERTVETFSATVQGPNEIEERGVSVGVQTADETVWATEKNDKVGSRSADSDALHKPSK